MTPGERMDVINASPFAGKYEERIDRDSAAELLVLKREERSSQADADKAAAVQAKLDAHAAKDEARQAATREREAARLETAKVRAAARTAARPSATQKIIETAARSAASTIGRQLAGSVGKNLLRGILGSLFK